MSKTDYAKDQRRQKRAEKEIAESVILTDYLVALELDMNDIANFTSKAVKAALEWRRSQNGHRRL